MEPGGLGLRTRSNPSAASARVAAGVRSSSRPSTSGRRQLPRPFGADRGLPFVERDTPRQRRALRPPRSAASTRPPPWPAAPLAATDKACRLGGWGPGAGLSIAGRAEHHEGGEVSRTIALPTPTAEFPAVERATLVSAPMFPRALLRRGSRRAALSLRARAGDDDASTDAGPSTLQRDQAASGGELRRRVMMPVRIGMASSRMGRGACGSTRTRARRRGDVRPGRPQALPNSSAQRRITAQPTNDPGLVTRTRAHLDAWWTSTNFPCPRPETPTRSGLARLSVACDPAAQRDSSSGSPVQGRRRSATVDLHAFRCDDPLRASRGIVDALFSHGARWPSTAPPGRTRTRTS